MSNIFGLPAHPLFVHVPVVLIPLAGIGALAMACSQWVRNQFGWLILGAAVVAGLSTQLAVTSGQALRHHVPPSAALRRHVHIAESIRPLILVLFVVALGVMLLYRRARSAWPFERHRGRPVTPAVRVALIVVTAVVAVGTNVRLFQIGHSGAQATWTRLENKGSARP